MKETQYIMQTENISSNTVCFGLQTLHPSKISRLSVVCLLFIYIHIYIYIIRYIVVSQYSISMQLYGHSVIFLQIYSRFRNQQRCHLQTNACVCFTTTFEEARKKYRPPTVKNNLLEKLSLQQECFMFAQISMYEDSKGGRKV